MEFEIGRGEFQISNFELQIGDSDLEWERAVMDIMNGMDRMDA